MQGLSANLKSHDSGIEKIYIPKSLMPSTGFGELKLIIEDGKIISCKTTTSHKIIERIKTKRE